MPIIQFLYKWALLFFLFFFLNKDPQMRSNIDLPVDQTAATNHTDYFFPLEVTFPLDSVCPRN